MNIWQRVGRLIKAKNRQGGLVVRKHAGSSFFTKALDELIVPGVVLEFIPPQYDVVRSACISRVSKLSDTDILVYFEEITSQNEAEGLVGLECLVEASVFEEACAGVEEDEPFGYEVFVVEEHAASSGLSKRFIGRVVDIIENPGQALLEVEAWERTAESKACVLESEAFIIESETCAVETNECVSEFADGTAESGADAADLETGAVEVAECMAEPKAYVTESGTHADKPESRTYLIPFVEDFIVSCDVASKQLILNLPAGLLEL